MIPSISIRSISIHALREERDLGDRLGDVVCPAISIHALREERDSGETKIRFRPREFQSTRSARSATSRHDTDEGSVLFQSTRSARSATASRLRRGWRCRYFNPRAPRGARPAEVVGDDLLHGISIHALREERDSGRTRWR